MSERGCARTSGALGRRHGGPGGGEGAGNYRVHGRGRTYYIGTRLGRQTRRLDGAWGKSRLQFLSALGDAERCGPHVPVGVAHRRSRPHHSARDEISVVERRDSQSSFRRDALASFVPPLGRAARFFSPSRVLAERQPSCARAGAPCTPRPSECHHRLDWMGTLRPTRDKGWAAAAAKA